MDWLRLVSMLVLTRSCVARHSRVSGISGVSVGRECLYASRVAANEWCRALAGLDL